MRNLLDFISDLNSKPDDPWQTIRDYYSRNGFDGVVCGTIDKNTSQVAGMIINMPDKWEQEYILQNYVEIDPWAPKSITATEPFIYSFDERRQLFDNPETDVEEMLCNTKENNLNSSLLFPALEAGNFVVAMNVWSTNQADEQISYINQNLDELCIAGAVSGLKMKQSLLDFTYGYTDDEWIKHPDFINPLSPREKELLLRLASGHRNDQIAYTMGISIVTVNFHLQSIRRKLKAETREQALAIAITRKFINP